MFIRRRQVGSHCRAVATLPRLTLLSLSRLGFGPIQQPLPIGVLLTFLTVLNLELAKYRDGGVSKESFVLAYFTQPVFLRGRRMEVVGILGLLTAFPDNPL